MLPGGKGGKLPSAKSPRSPGLALRAPLAAGKRGLVTDSLLHKPKRKAAPEKDPAKVPPAAPCHRVARNC